MTTSAFESFRRSLYDHAAKHGTQQDRATIHKIFVNTHNFLASQQLTTDNPQAGQESLGVIPKLIISNADTALENINIDALSQFIKSCDVPEDAQNTCAVEVARILSGRHGRALDFVEKGRVTKEQIPLSQIYGAESIATIQKQGRQAIESYGEYSDRVTSDSRLSVSLTIIRANKSLIDRILPRKAAEDPVVIIKIPSPEVYDLDKSQNPSATVRYEANRQPLITLYRNPDVINTTPQQIIPQLANDTATPPGLLANNVISAGQKVNLFSETLNSSLIGYQAVDYTDLVSDGGSVDAIYVQATFTPTGGGAVTKEVFRFPTRYLRQASFTTQTNVQDSGDRAANIRAKYNITAGTLTYNITTGAVGPATSIFSTFTTTNELLEITFNANLNIKTSYVSGSGAINATLSPIAPATSVPAGVATIANEVTFAVIGWSPYLFFSEENMRKTTAAVRLNWKEIEFLIPVGRNYIVDYSLFGQEVGEATTNTVSEVMNIGNSIRSINIINDTLTAVNNRLQYENANPDIDYYSSVAQDFAAGTLSLPHVYIGTIDVTSALVMRESERLSDLHSYLTYRILALIADAHNKSLYTENFEGGERARYKGVTSGPIAEVLFGIKQYWNTLDDKVEVAENSSYSLKLPNGTQLDIIKSNFEFFADKIILIPIRDSKPDDVTSFGTILDRGTYVGQYNPVSNGAANRRIVANSREIVFPTNPLGFIITIAGIAAQLEVVVDGPGLSQ